MFEVRELKTYVLTYLQSLYNVAKYEKIRILMRSYPRNRNKFVQLGFNFLLIWCSIDNLIVRT